MDAQVQQHCGAGQPPVRPQRLPGAARPGGACASGKARVEAEDEKAKLAAEEEEKTRLAEEDEEKAMLAAAEEEKARLVAAEERREASYIGESRKAWSSTCTTIHEEAKTCYKPTYRKTLPPAGRQ